MLLLILISWGKLRQRITNREKCSMVLADILQYSIWSLEEYLDNENINKKYFHSPPSRANIYLVIIFIDVVQFLIFFMYSRYSRCFYLEEYEISYTVLKVLSIEYENIPTITNHVILDFHLFIINYHILGNEWKNCKYVCTVCIISTWNREGIFWIIPNVLFFFFILSDCGIELKVTSISFLLKLDSSISFVSGDTILMEI